MAQSLLFEHPLDEQTRTMLRLAHLFEQFDYHVPGENQWHSRAALKALLDIANILARPDLKSELSKTLEQQAKSLRSIAHNPKVDQNRLERVLTDIEHISQQLHGTGGQIGNALRKSEFLNSIQQRECIPGGSFEFDLPQFHFWLNLPQEERILQLKHWHQDVKIIQEATTLLLGMLRNSATFVDYTCERGLFQHSLDSKRPVQLIQVRIDPELKTYAAISGSKHRFCIRFMDTTNWDQPEQSKGNLPFKLKTCVL